MCIPYSDTPHDHEKFRRSTSVFTERKAGGKISPKKFRRLFFLFPSSSRLPLLAPRRELAWPVRGLGRPPVAHLLLSASAAAALGFVPCPGTDSSPAYPSRELGFRRLGHRGRRDLGFRAQESQKFPRAR